MEKKNLHDHCKDVVVDHDNHVTDGLQALALSPSEEAEIDVNNTDKTSFEDGIMDNNFYGALADLEEETNFEEPKNSKRGDTSSKNVQNKPVDPVLQQLRQLNDQVNRMRTDQIKKKLKQFNLDAKGTRTVLQKRLKAHYKRIHCKEQDHLYKYFVVIDFEATCDSLPSHYRHEIIEFPAVLVSTKKRKIVDKFHSYVRPIVNPKLTAFCTSLTGITQDKVNFAPEFPEVLIKFEAWLKERNLLSDYNSFAIITDGPWDMGRFLFFQCKLSKVTYPPWAKTWINIKKPFCNFYKTERLPLKEMLDHLGMTFIGQPHCGLDDARNIARVALKLFEDGANMRVNEKINFRKSLVQGEKSYTVKNISKDEFHTMIKRRNLDPKPDRQRQAISDEEEEDEDCDSDSEGIFNKNSEVPTYQNSDYEKDYPSLCSKPQMSK
ncbi:3'-5' exoribonuclease 1 [Halocaridina rubra]|uniref:3'-5' exoribonuclease 1 n=1 Tax=Halocaridina rubra TaxID=373956 RepID=A0AAN8XG58_HALRR